jgi:manganese transport protein
MPVLAALATLLLYVILAPALKRLVPAFAPAAPSPPVPVLPAARAAVAVTAVPEQALYRRIAVALEMGPADRAVLEHVPSLVRSAETELVLVHVAESAASRYLGPETLDLESREDRESLEALAEQFRRRGIRTEVRLGHGAATAELARLVNEAEADLLVTGSHGHRLIGDLVHGATASGVRHLVRCPVLTVPRAEPGP